MTLDRLMYIRGTGALAGGEQVLLGVYEDMGDTPQGGALLEDTGAVACIAGTSEAQEVPLTASLQLTPELYWFAIMFDTATANLYYHQSGAYWADEGSLECRKYTAAGFTLTDPCPAITEAGSVVAVIYARVESVP